MKAVVTGTGKPGATLKLFADGVFVGSTTVLNDGTYSVTSSDLTPGTHPLTISQTSSGAVSASVDAGTVDVAPSPPAWSTTTLQGSNAVISGTGFPGGTIEVYEGNTKVATTTVAVDGTWSAITTNPLSLGTHSFTAKQLVDNIASSSVSAGSVTLTATTTVKAGATTAPAPGGATTPAAGGATTPAGPAPTTNAGGATTGASPQTTAAAGQVRQHWLLKLFDCCFLLTISFISPFRLKRLRLLPPPQQKLKVLLLLRPKRQLHRPRPKAPPRKR